MRINLQRMQDILTGDAEPQTKGEKVFLMAYEAGVSGHLLNEFLTEINSDSFSRDELDMMLYGYCVGEKELNMEYDVIYVKKKNDEDYIN